MRHVMSLFMGLMLLTVPAAAQQNPTERWSAVAALPAGTVVELQRQSGTVKGTISSVSDTSLVLAREGQPTTAIDRPSITRVYRTGSRHIGLATAIGAGIGAGVGAGIGAGACSGRNSYCKASQGVEVAVPILAVVGAVIGGLIGLHRGKTLIYRAPKSGAVS